MTEPSTPVYCANHPGVETSLRCNHCGKPICAKCAVRTPTGYRCRECVRSQQKLFETAVPLDFVLGFFTAAILSFLASLLVERDQRHCRIFRIHHHLLRRPNGWHRHCRGRALCHPQAPLPPALHHDKRWQ